jgi:hypothetical protein
LGMLWNLSEYFFDIIGKVMRSLRTSHWLIPCWTFLPPPPPAIQFERGDCSGKPVCPPLWKPTAQAVQVVGPALAIIWLLFPRMSHLFRTLSWASDVDLSANQLRCWVTAELVQLAHTQTLFQGRINKLSLNFNRVC